MPRYRRKPSKIVSFFGLDDPIGSAANFIVSVMATAVLYVGAVFKTSPEKMDDKALEPFVRDLTDTRISADSLGARGFYAQDLFIVKTDYGPAYLDSCRQMYLPPKSAAVNAFSDSQRRTHARQIADCVYTAGKEDHDARKDTAVEVGMATLRFSISIFEALAASEQ